MTIEFFDTVGVATLLAAGEDSAPHYQAVGRTGGFRGIVHAKLLLVGDVLLIGSTNWTTSSRSNKELTSKLRLSEVSEKMVRDILREWAGEGVPLRAEQQARERRTRSKSVATISPTRTRSLSFTQDSGDGRLWNRGVFAATADAQRKSPKER